MRRFYARVEHNELWALVCSICLPLLVNLDSAALWDEAARTDFTRTLTRDWFHRLTCTRCIRWLAGVCLSHFSRIGFDEEGPYEG